ncbi:helix-turn-helix domain-containing protein [Streptomyces sp. S399]|uniref:helix-turn-helix domain-containing protein n=1 Tax=Streptomyces sp. S399 TaxID=3096009 RepID=UPI002A820771|nr:helix-turn-helix domain-containing protein [Streptomyces sp. S399]WPR52788.1 helix-turn-helix domain-containing protein [Streptomyces sp. S399]
MSTSGKARLGSRYRPRLRGEERTRVAAAVGAEYAAGAGIRAIAEARDLSYGTARALILESGARLRGPGGSKR